MAPRRRGRRAPVRASRAARRSRRRGRAARRRSAGAPGQAPGGAARSPARPSRPRAPARRSALGCRGCAARWCAPPAEDIRGAPPERAILRPPRRWPMNRTGHLRVPRAARAGSADAGSSLPRLPTFSARSFLRKRRYARAPRGLPVAPHLGVGIPRRRRLPRDLMNRRPRPPQCRRTSTTVWPDRAVSVGALETREARWRRARRAVQNSPSARRPPG